VDAREQDAIHTEQRLHPARRFLEEQASGADSSSSVEHSAAAALVRDQAARPSRSQSSRPSLSSEWTFQVSLSEVFEVSATTRATKDDM
jgi:hypothetical protein